MTDKELIKQIKKNPENGIASAIKTYGPNVKAVCCSILRTCTSEDIEEAFSDTFVKLWRSVDQFDERKNASLKTYIITIARNTALDYLRKKGRNPISDLGDYDVIDLTDGPEKKILSKQTEEKIHQAISEMGEPERTIFILRFFYCLPIKNIAEKLELKPKQVENILYKRKEKLREELIQKGVW